VAGWTRFTEKEQELVIKLDKEQKTHQEIADTIGKERDKITELIKRLIKKGRIERKARKKRVDYDGCKIPQEEEAKRMRIYKSKATDKEGGALCGVTPGAFTFWRTTRGLPKLFTTVRGSRAKTECFMDKPVLKVDDLKYYHHNNNTPKADNNKIMLSVEINGTYEMAPIIAQLADRVETRRKWQDDERHRYHASVDVNNVSYILQKGAM